MESYGSPRLSPKGPCGVDGEVIWGDCPNGWYVFPMGFNRTAVVGAGLPVVATTKPQKMLRTKAFVVPSEIAQFYVINRIELGVGGQQISQDVMPGSMFSEVSTQNCLAMETGQIGIDMQINATNVDTVDHPFHCGMFAYASGRQC